MYNEQVKQAFIEAYSSQPSTQKLVRHIFGSLESHESANGIDFAQMNIEQMQPAINDTVGMRQSGAESVLYILREYVKWCARSGKAVSDAIWHVRIDTVEKIRSRMVASPSHLRLIIDTVFPNSEDNSIEYILRAYLWIAFIGFEDFEAIQIRSDEVDLSSMLIRYAGNKTPYLIYSEAVPDIEKARILTEFVEPRGTKGVLKQRASGDLLLRGKVSKKSMGDSLVTTIRPTLSRAFKSAAEAFEGKEIPRNLSLNLSYDRVYLSGIFYRTYERERIGIPPSFDAIVEREMSRKLADEVYTLSKDRTPGKIRNVLLKGYVEDYARWKYVFTV